MPRCAAVSDERPWTGRRLHLVGIGGAGMSGLRRSWPARSAPRSRARTAAGRSPRSTRLRAAGIDASRRPRRGQRAGRGRRRGRRLDRDPGRTTPSARPAASAGCASCTAPSCWARSPRCARTIAVAGAHGKTTTTCDGRPRAAGAAGTDPGYLIGGELRDDGPNAGVGDGRVARRRGRRVRPLVAARWRRGRGRDERRARPPRDLRLARRARRGLPRVPGRAPRTRSSGTGRSCARWPGPARGRFDVADPDLDADGAALRAGAGPRSALAVPGAHNARNAAAALEALRLAGRRRGRGGRGAGDASAGAGRRFERPGPHRRGARLVVDDYAHHPTEVAATIAAARTLRPRRVVAVFQPHLFSRTRQLAREFGARWPRPTSRRSSTSTRRASGPRTSRASAA